MKSTVDPEILNLAFALTTNKTLKTWSHLHYCRDHKQFVKGDHLNSCTHLKLIDFPDLKPTHFQDWWDKQEQMISST